MRAVSCAGHVQSARCVRPASQPSALCRRKRLVLCLGPQRGHFTVSTEVRPLDTSRGIQRLETRGAMSRQESDATQVSFHDASPYFSEEEWTLLKEWQKELCRNLMKEIHQALISLGPLIATPVLSLKAKEKQKLYPKNSQESKRHSLKPSPSLANLNKPCLAGLCILGKEDTEPTTSRDTEQGNIISLTIKDEEESSCPDDEDSMTVEHIGGPPVQGNIISLTIKDEEESSCPDDKDSMTVEHIGGPPGNCLEKAEEQVPVSANHLVEEDDVSISDPDSKVPVITAVFSLSTKPEEEISLQKTSEPEKRTTADLSDPGNMISKESSLCCERNRNFTSKPTLNQGQVLILEEKIPLTECDTRFIRNISLPYQETKETGPQSFLCEKNFTQNVPLQCHQKIHMGEKTYICNECGKSFRQTTSLKRHQIVHNGNNPFPCSECERSFVYKTDLERHLRFHRGDKLIACSICGKTFMYKSHLQRHLIFHTGERPFPCTKCDKRFAQKINLLKHQKVHTEVSL
ncbi:zinc finger protein 773-like isoform X3 [Pleurodeles waltl]|uniref:zinc finger protein 773-like isoform X3 n=1 Tax=Pleurodeles waltl TaxID=8319 RepID=UPI0037094FC2